MVIRYKGFSDDKFPGFERRSHSKHINLVNLRMISTEYTKIRILENLSTHQYDWNFIDLLYCQTEFYFMQSDESNDGKRETENP